MPLGGRPVARASQPCIGGSRAALVMVAVAAIVLGCGSTEPSVSSAPVASGPSTTAADPTMPSAAPTVTPEPPIGEVSCSAAGPVATSPLEASPDGVHLRLDLPDDVQIVVRDTLGRPTQDGLGSPGDTISYLGPGEYTMACRDTTTDLVTPWVPLSIIDPTGIWVDDRVIDCPDRSTGIADYGQGTKGISADDLVEDLRQHVQGLRPGDQVTVAGYPEGAPHKVRIVRDGRVIALAEYEAFEQPDNWVRSTYTYCTSIGPRG